MSRRSSIARQKREIRESIDALVRDGGYTLDQILDHIRGMGGEVSRSALGRYVQKAEVQLERFRQAQEVAKVWVGKLEENPEGDVGRLLAEMLRTVAFQTIGDLGDGEDPTDPAHIMLLARSIKDLASADKIHTERELRIRKEERERAAKAAAKIAKRGGMSADTVEQIRREILGIRDG